MDGPECATDIAECMADSSLLWIECAVCSANFLETTRHDFVVISRIWLTSSCTAWQFEAECEFDIFSEYSGFKFPRQWHKKCKMLVTAFGRIRVWSWTTNRVRLWTIDTEKTLSIPILKKLCQYSRHRLSERRRHKKPLCIWTRCILFQFPNGALSSRSCLETLWCNRRSRCYHEGEFNSQSGVRAL